MTSSRTTFGEPRATGSAVYSRGKLWIRIPRDDEHLHWRWTNNSPLQEGSEVYRDAAWDSIRDGAVLVDRVSIEEAFAAWLGER